MATLITKNAVKNPKKGEFYFVKNGSVYAVKPNRKGGKKGRVGCTTRVKIAAKKAAVTRRKNAKKKVAAKRKPVTRRKVTRRKSVKKK